MADNVYEGMFILDTNQYGRDPDGVSRQLSTAIEEAGGEILVSRFWEERRLAYPINGQRKGAYWLTYFRVDSRRLSEIKSKNQLNGNIIRALYLKVDSRIVETLVAHAKAGTIASYSIPDEPIKPEVAAVAVKDLPDEGTSELDR